MTQKLVQLLIVADGKLEMTRDDTGLLVVAGSVTGQLEDFGCEILEDGGQVDWGTGTNTLSVVALSEETVDTADWESETSLGGTTVAIEVSQGSSDIAFDSNSRGDELKATRQRNHLECPSL